MRRNSNLCPSKLPVVALAGDYLECNVPSFFSKSRHLHIHIFCNILLASLRRFRSPVVNGYGRPKQIPLVQTERRVGSLPSLNRYTAATNRTSRPLLHPRKCLRSIPPRLHGRDLFNLMGAGFDTCII